MGWTNETQLYNLFLSCGFGFCLGVYYDVFRVIRLVMRPGKRSIFFQDLLFFSTTAVFTFIFALIVTGGALRWYIFVGELIGFFAYYFTIGRVVVACAERVCALILWLWHGLWWVIFWPFRTIGRLLRRPAAFLAGKFRKMGEKGILFFKKGLKRVGSVLYNHRVSKLKQAGSAAVGHTEGNSELR